MQFLQIDETTTLSELSHNIGPRNVEPILAANDLDWSPNVGQNFRQKCQGIIASVGSVTWQRKSTVLNTFTQDSDAFETAALLGASGWKVLSQLGTFPDMLKVPESIVLPDSVNVLGNQQGVSKSIYRAAMQSLQNPPHQIDPSIFNEYSTIKHSSIGGQHVGGDIFQSFKIPWGAVTLYSSIPDQSVDFPVYPESVKDGVKANYTTMPDMIMQYEPWQIYTSSGPRSNTYLFKMHRDMWTGNHTDGMCNKLIRFCEANCYPEYSGSAVNTSIVTLYINGSPLISGVMTDVSVEWDGPIGSDGWYLSCALELSITEVSKEALNFNVIKNKGLIG